MITFFKVVLLHIYPLIEISLLEGNSLFFKPIVLLFTPLLQEYKLFFPVRLYLVKDTQNHKL